MNTFKNVISESVISKPVKSGYWFTDYWFTDYSYRVHGGLAHCSDERSQPLLKHRPAEIHFVDRAFVTDHVESARFVPAK